MPMICVVAIGVMRFSVCVTSVAHTFCFLGGEKEKGKELLVCGDSFDDIDVCFLDNVNPSSYTCVRKDDEVEEREANLRKD